MFPPEQQQLVAKLDCLADFVGPALTDVGNVSLEASRDRIMAFGLMLFSHLKAQVRVALIVPVAC